MNRIINFFRRRKQRKAEQGIDRQLETFVSGVARPDITERDDLVEQWGDLDWKHIQGKLNEDQSQRFAAATLRLKDRIVAREES